MLDLYNGRGVGERDNAELVASGCEVFLRKLLRQLATAAIAHQS